MRAATALMMGSAKVPSTLLNGLINLWKRDGNCTDSVGSRNGTDTNVTYGTGVNGQCAIYNATGYSQISAWTLTSQFTLNFWVKRNTTGTRQLFFGDSSSAGNATTLQLAIEFTSADKINCYIVDSAINVSVLSSSGTYTDTNWHMVTVTKNGTANTLYVDGVSVGTSTSVLSTLNASVNPFCFGRSGDYASFYFNGSLDESGYWNRPITAPELAELYAKFYPY